MEKGRSRTTDMVLRFLDRNTKDTMESYVQDAKYKKYLSIKSKDDLNRLFKSNTLLFLSSLSEEELLTLRSYTGTDHANINAILRNNWTYEKNGYLDDSIKMKYKRLSYEISKILRKFPPLDNDFIAYRGTTINSFSKYGINTIEDLKHMMGKYIYEEGFTSTSLIESDCYFNKDFKDGNKYNIKIRYLISPECNEGALLSNTELSYYSGKESEYLISNNSLSKVVDVQINGDTAVLTVVLIPEKVWNLEVQNDYQPIIV